MLKRRIIPCLDVKDGLVVKGKQFLNHRVIGDILSLARFYQAAGADELVFYDISASPEQRCVNYQWVHDIAINLNIPFCVAGGIRTIAQAEAILAAGADKISINSPALENPDLIDALAARFGSQCVVVGIDSMQMNEHYYVYQYTGDPNQSHPTQRTVSNWAQEACKRGAGEIVLNCMNQDGEKKGYDLTQLRMLAQQITIPLIASGGAGQKEDFLQLFSTTTVFGALAASVFHDQLISIPQLKVYLDCNGIAVRRSA